MSLNLFDRVFYINCRHRTDRKESIESVLKSLDCKNYQRIEAVYIPENGALGCAKSHLMALQESIKSASANLELTKKNRNIDISPNVWMSTTPPYVSSSTQYNSTLAYGFGVSIPIPVHLVYDADVVQAANNKTSSESYLNDLKAKVVTEVNQAYLQYDFAKKKFEAAKSAYDAAVKSLNNSNVRSIINLRDREGEFVDAKVNHAKALFYLQRVSGIYELPRI